MRLCRWATSVCSLQVAYIFVHFAKKDLFNVFKLGCWCCVAMHSVWRPGLQESMAFPKLLLATKSWWKIRRLTLYTLAPSRPFTRRGSAHDTWRQWCMLHMFAISWHVLYILEVFAIHAWPAGADADGHRCWKACALWEADCYITDGCWGDVRSSRGDISHITSQPRIELERLGPMMTYVDYVVRCSQVLLFG